MPSLYPEDHLLEDSSLNESRVEVQPGASDGTFFLPSEGRYPGLGKGFCCRELGL